MSSIDVFSPSTVANVGSGFDVLGFALEGIGDRITVSLRDDHHIQVRNNTGYDIPENPHQNIICIAIAEMLAALKRQQGYDLVIREKIKPGSGLGSSGSSAAAGVYAMNELLGKPFDRKDLTSFAMAGEKAVSLKAHADNVAASLYGGFILVRSYHPLEVISLDYPEDLVVAIIYPQVEVKTAEAKKLLKEYLPLDVAISQWGNLGALVHGLQKGDRGLIGRSISDAVAEPVRSMLIPEYQQVREAAKEMGAFAFNISGSGPSMFAFCESREIAEAVVEEGEKIYSAIDMDLKTYISGISQEGTRKG